MRIFIILFAALTLPFTSSAQDWYQFGTTIEGPAQNVFLGTAVCMNSDGSRMAFGGPGYSLGTGLQGGFVVNYEWGFAGWSLLGDTIWGVSDGEMDGNYIDYSDDGNTLAVGAYGNDDNGQDAGHVRVFDWDGTDWSLRGTAILGDSAGDYSGYGVALSSDGNTVAIGSIHSNPTGTIEGSFRVYEWSAGAWAAKGASIYGTVPYSEFGSALALDADGSTVIVGAGQNLSDDGYAKVYAWNGGAWAQKGATFENPGMGYKVGESVSISDDGNTVAIGSPENNEQGDSSGAAKVYTWNNSAWTQQGATIFGTADSKAGSGVSLSADGASVAVGMPWTASFISQTGFVGVYDWDNTSWIIRGSGMSGSFLFEDFGTGVALSSDGNAVAVGSKNGSPNSVQYAGTAKAFRYGIANGTEELQSQNEFKVYPTPTQGTVTMEFSELPTTVHVSVYSFDGQLQSEQTIENNTRGEMTIEGAAGVYFVQVVGVEGVVMYERVVKY